MFSKAKPAKSMDGAMQQPSQGAQTPPTSAAVQSPRKGGSMKPSGVPSIISNDVVMVGNINAGGEVQFDGSLEGDIKAGSLIIGEKAVVKGEVVCETVTVRGRVEGGIRAKAVSLASTAYIQGDILHSSLQVESGAHFEGNCRHSDDPLSESSAKDFRRSRPSAPAPRPVTSDSKDNSGAELAGAGDAPSFLNQNRSPLR